MAAYEKYDLSGGWYEYLLAINEMHCERTRSVAKNEKDDDKQMEFEAIACDDEKLLSDLRQYIRKDMSIKLFPSQTHRIVRILLEACIILEGEAEYAKEEENKANKKLIHFLKFSNKIFKDVVEFAKSSEEDESEIEQDEENVPRDVGTP